MENGVVQSREIKGLQISTIGQFVKLTKGQAGLLKVIRSSVSGGSSISWDIVVDVYYNNVSKILRQEVYLGRGEDGHSRYGYKERDVKEIYNLQDSTWQYSLRSRIRQWFVSTIGILVLKNQLIVIPTIEID